MANSKNELFDMINNLSAEQLQLVYEYVKRLQADGVLNNKAFNYVISNYSKTLEGLDEKWSIFKFISYIKFTYNKK